MIVARDHTGRLALAGDGTPPYTCPHCGDAPLVVKQGEIVAAHFAHRPDADCHESEPETAWHIAAKHALAGRLLGADLEVPIGRARADVASWKQAVAVEVQHSPITVADWRARTAEMNRVGFAVLWVWSPARLRWVPDSYGIDEEDDRFEDGARWRLCAPMLACEPAGIYVYDHEANTLHKLLTRRSWNTKTIRRVRWLEAPPGAGTLSRRLVDGLRLGSLWVADSRKVLRDAA